MTGEMTHEEFRLYLKELCLVGFTFIGYTKTYGNGRARAFRLSYSMCVYAYRVEEIRIFIREGEFWHLHTDYKPAYHTVSAEYFDIDG